jgi:hypothetical protein
MHFEIERDDKRTSLDLVRLLSQLIFIILFVLFCSVYDCVPRTRLLLCVLLTVTLCPVDCYAVSS